MAGPRHPRPRRLSPLTNSRPRPGGEQAHVHRRRRDRGGRGRAWSSSRAFRARRSPCDGRASRTRAAPRLLQVQIPGSTARARSAHRLPNVRRRHGGRSPVRLTLISTASRRTCAVSVAIAGAWRRIEFAAQAASVTQGAGREPVRAATSCSPRIRANARCRATSGWAGSDSIDNSSGDRPRRRASSTKHVSSLSRVSGPWEASVSARSAYPTRSHPPDNRSPHDRQRITAHAWGTDRARCQAVRWRRRSAWRPA